MSFMANADNFDTMKPSAANVSEGLGFVSAGTKRKRKFLTLVTPVYSRFRCSITKPVIKNGITTIGCTDTCALWTVVAQSTLQ